MERQNLSEPPLPYLGARPPPEGSWHDPSRLALAVGWLILVQHTAGQLEPLLLRYFWPRAGFFGMSGLIPFGAVMDAAYRVGLTAQVLLAGGLLALSGPLAKGRPRAHSTALTLASVVLATEGLGTLAVLRPLLTAILFSSGNPLQLLPGLFSPVIVVLDFLLVVDLAMWSGVAPTGPPEAEAASPHPHAGPRTMVLSYLMSTAPTRLRRTGALLLRVFAGLLGTAALVQLALVAWRLFDLWMTRPALMAAPPLFFWNIAVLWGFSISLFGASAAVCLVLAKLVRAGSRNAALTAMLLSWPVEVLAVLAAGESFASFVVHFRDPHDADRMPTLIACAVVFAVSLPASVLMLDAISVFRVIARDPLNESNLAPGRLQRNVEVARGDWPEGR